ncbi:MAG: IS110 family transposase [Candidatus Gastranaerophilaceae bacterium]
MRKLCVGIDIAKSKFDVMYTTDGENYFGYSTFPNDKKGIKKFAKQSEKFLKQENCERIHFCMEATGIYHCELCEYLQNSAHIVSVVNPVRTKSFAKSLQLRTKNDKVDSQMIAHYTFLHNPQQTPKVSKELQHFRRLVKFKETLVDDRAKELVRLKTALDSDVKQLINKRINFLEKQIKETIYKIETVVKENEFLSRNFNLLITIEGINFNVAWRILAELHYETINDITPKSLVAHAGLSPRENSSGDKYGKVSISKIGKSDLRKMMYMPALSCIRHDNYFTSFYLHLLEKGKPKKVAITAVMRKMILTAMGVLRNQESFDPNWSKKVQAKYQERLKIA